jgi:gliding motility-associated-like protein
VSTPVEVELIVRERPPAAQFEPQEVICEGASFELGLIAPLDADQYRWFSPDQSMTTTQTPELTISQAQLSMTGRWEVEVVRNGCSSDSLGEIDIEVEALPVLDVNQNGSLCEGDSVILSVEELSGASYSWSTPNGSYSGAEIKTPARSGSYVVTYLSSNGCQTTAGIDLEQIQPPDITAISNTATDCIPSGQDIELSASVFPMDTGSYVYEWSGPNGFVDTHPVGVIPNVSASDNGWYKLRVRESGCWSNLDSTFVDVTIIPDVPEITGSKSYCVGDTLKLSIKDSLGLGTSYIWLTPKGDTLTQALDLSLVLSDPFFSGYYQVRASVEGCRGPFSDSVYVRVTSLPEIPTPSGILEVCEGETLLIQAASLDPSLDYRWEFSNGEVLSRTVVLIGNAGTEWTGTVRGEAFKNGCPSGLSPPTDILVKPLPAVPAIEPVDGGVCLLDDAFSFEVCISDSSATGGVNYQWFDATDFSALSELSGSLCFTLNQDLDWQAGQNSFTVRAEKAECVSDFSVPVNVVASQPTDFDPMAGIGDTICGGGSFFTQALPPMQGSGEWFVGSGHAQFVDPQIAQTEVFDFDFGENVLIWSLTDGFCANYAEDSIRIWYDDAPFARPDSFSTPYNERRRLNVLINDEFRGRGSLSVSQNPQFGEVQNQAEEFLYFPRNGFIGVDTFIYQICSDLCPQLCDETEVVVQVGDESLCDIPTIFTPNSDGINDFFVIQCLSSNDYPNNKLVIFNQNGSEVFYSEPYRNDWSGKYKGMDLPVGTYFYILDFGNGQPPQRGFLILER